MPLARNSPDLALGQGHPLKTMVNLTTKPLAGPIVHTILDRLVWKLGYFMLPTSSTQGYHDFSNSDASPQPPARTHRFETPS